MLICYETIVLDLYGKLMCLPVDLPVVSRLGKLNGLHYL